MITHLEAPLFYRYDIGLRFEIGPDDQDTFLDRDKDCELLNHSYFEEAIRRATQIYHSTFRDQSALTLTLQSISDGRQRIPNSDKVMRRIIPLAISDIRRSKRSDIYDTHKGYPYWNQLEVDVETKNLPIDYIFNLIAYSDFGSGFHRYCFFSSLDKSIALNFYDDRGLDVVASNRELIQNLYEDYNSWILDHDRSRMDEVFSDTVILK